MLQPTVGCLQRNSHTQTDRATEKAAIERVLECDNGLGRIRNQAARSMGLSQASHVYARALRKMDYAGSPANFRDAFLEHANAWEDVADEIKRHPEFDALRNEMHAAFDDIKGRKTLAARRVQKKLDEVWATWRVVERIAKERGASVE